MKNFQEKLNKYISLSITAQTQNMGKELLLFFLNLNTIRKKKFLMTFFISVAGNLNIIRSKKTSAKDF